MKAITKKLLLASVTIGVLTPFSGWGVVYAEEVTVQPENPSDNEVEINESDYNVNGNTSSLGSGNYYYEIYGGYSDSTSTFNDTITLNGGTINRAIFGGRSPSNSIYGNKIYFNGGSFYNWESSDGINGTIFGGYSSSSEIHDNEIIIGEDIDTSLIGIIGGRSASGDIYNNIITVNSSDINVSGNISGGQSESGKVYNNTINIYGGNINSVGGADVDTGESYENTINIYGGTFGNVYGGVSSNGTSHDETVNIFGGTITGMIDGGDYNGTVNFSGGTFTGSMIRGSRYGYGGTVNITGGTLAGSIFGTRYDSGDAYNNTVSISNAAYNVDDNGIFGALGANAYNNTVNIYSGTFSTGSHPTLIIGGAIMDNGVAHDNTVNIEGGNFSGNIVAGSGNSDSEVYNNILNVKGGNFLSGYLAAGSGTNVHDNEINISGSPDLSGVTLHGSYPDSGTNNTLNIYTKNLTTQNIYNFNSLNFYIPNDAANGDTILTLTDTEGTDLSGVSINAGVVEGNTNLQVGDTINLLTNSNGLITTSGTTYGTLTEGVSLNYGLIVSHSGNSITANINSITGLNSQTDSLPVSTGVSGVQSVDNSLDLQTLPESNEVPADTETPTDESVNQESSNVQVVEPRGYEIFANMGGGSLRTKAGNGSYVDMTSRNINLGFARSFQSAAGRFTIAPIIDYAHGNYDSYLIDGTHGSGSTRYIAGGLIARRMLQNGFYYETSVRVGKIKTDFSSSDLDSSGVFGTVTYDTSATTLAGHLKLGRVFRLDQNNLLDIYAIYSHAHQGGMTADLSSGEHYDFSSADSGRFRVGYRLSTRTSKISQIYTGLAYQFENSSGITAQYKGYETHSAGESGSSGMLEIGWLVKPFTKSPWAIDINSTGWVGHQRGVTAMAKILKAF